MVGVRATLATCAGINCRSLRSIQRVKLLASSLDRGGRRILGVHAMQALRKVVANLKGAIGADTAAFDGPVSVYFLARHVKR